MQKYNAQLKEVPETSTTLPIKSSNFPSANANKREAAQQ